MDIEKIDKILEGLEQAIDRAIKNGGVTQYSLNTSQSQTSVKQSSLSELVKLQEHYQNKRNELVALKTGANFTIVRG